MALATSAGSAQDGPSVALRNVVLREADVARRRLAFYTDARSPKVGQLAAQPQASLLLWCRQLGWQLRLQARIEVQTIGPAVSSRWARLKTTPAAQDYLRPLASGAPLPEGPEPPPAERDGAAHFALCSAMVDAMDWLDLHPDGHRRALFDSAGEGRWISP